MLLTILVYLFTGVLIAFAIKGVKAYIGEIKQAKEKKKARVNEGKNH